MKKILLIAAVTIASVSAHASKARLTALSNAAHLADIQDVVQSKPDQALNYEAATVEFGGNAGAPEAEGGFVRKMGDSAFGFYLGRSSTTYAAATSTAATGIGAGEATAADDALATAALNSAFAQDNTLQLTYAAKAGSINWGAGLFYVSNNFKNNTTFSSSTENLVAKKKQDIMGLLVSAGNGTWDAQLRQGLGGKTELDIASNTIVNLTGATKLTVESTNSTRLSGGYMMDTMYFYGAVEMGAAEAKTQTTTLADGETSNIKVGVVNTHKKDGVDFFYGAEIQSNMTKNKTAPTSKTESTLVPLLVGVEADVNSWMTLRGSLTQNLGLLSSTKSTGGSASSVTDSTATNVGAGFKWGKATVDVVMGMGKSGEFGTDAASDMFTNASVTYNF